MDSQLTNKSIKSGVTSRVQQILQESYEHGEKITTRPISVCVRNIWDIKSRYTEKSDICIGFMCYDHHGQLFEGRLIREIPPNDQDYLTEGEMYEFSWYSVCHNPRPRKLTKYPYFICINQSSKLSKVTDVSAMLPDDSFSTQNYKTLLRLVTTLTYLPDVVGQILMIQKRNPYHPERSTDFTIGLLLNRSTVVKLILWDKVATEFAILQSKKNRNSKVVIFTSLIPKLIEGKLHLNSSPATIFYFDKSIKQIKHFKRRARD